MHFLAKFPACTGHLHALNSLRSTRHAARQVRCHSSSDREVPPPDVRALAELAHISITAEQAADWEPKIRGIVDWFGELQTVDVSNVPLAIRADVDAGNVLRADVEQQFQQRDELLEDVPDREGPFVRVPKVAPSPTS